MSNITTGVRRYGKEGRGGRIAACPTCNIVNPATTCTRKHDCSTNWEATPIDDVDGKVVQFVMQFSNKAWDTPSKIQINITR